MNKLSSGDSTRIITLNLNASQQRQIPVRILYPAKNLDGMGVLIFSHGAFSDYDLYDRVLEPWANRGFAVIAIRHLDSPQHPQNKIFPQQQQWRLRLEDMQVTLDAVTDPKSKLPGLKISLDPDKLVLAGHSYGAITALAMAGAKTLDMQSGESIQVTPANAAAVIAMSPPGLIPKYIEADAFSDLITPTLVQTGTKDVLENFIPEWELHRAAHDLSAARDKWLAVGENVDHYFGGLTGRFEVPGQPQQQALTDFVKLSDTFLDAYVFNNDMAKQQLQRAAEDQRWSDMMRLEQR